MAAGGYGVPLWKSDRLQLPLNDDHCTIETFRDWLARHDGDRLAVDLFTGAGGLSLGIQDAGWTIAAGVDFDERAVETHASNFPGLSLKLDLAEVEVRDHLVQVLSDAKIDLIAGGPPCQPFSRAGRNKIRDLVLNHGRDPDDLRKELWRAYLDIVTRVRPRAVLMENVPDMGLADDFAVIRILQDKLEKMGYATEVRLASASDFGVPQHRKRLILLARNDIDLFDWPDEKCPQPTLRDAIADLPGFNFGPRELIGDRELSYDESQGLSDLAQEMRDGAEPGVVHDHMTRAVREDDYAIFNRMTSTTLYSDLDESERRYRADSFTDKYKRLGFGDLSRTITAHIAKDGYWYIHPEEPRTLTVREAARVQTFPDRFRFAGTRSDAFRQIGNAVPPRLGRAAASALQPLESDDIPGVEPLWIQIREELAEWARADRDGERWYSYPAPEMGPVQAAVVALLAGTRESDLASIAEFVRGWKRITPGRYLDLLHKAPSRSAHKRLSRLTQAIDVPGIWNVKRRAELARLLELGPAQEAVFTMLLGQDDLLVLNQATLRVAARVAGSESDRTNRQTTGRVDLSRLVGAEEDASLRLAAVQIIGRTLCAAEDPNCAECPLAKVCREPRDGTDVHHETADGALLSIL